MVMFVFGAMGEDRLFLFLGHVGEDPVTLVAATAGSGWSRFLLAFAALRFVAKS
jgi:hypothetical protein